MHTVNSLIDAALRGVPLFFGKCPASAPRNRWIIMRAGALEERRWSTAHRKCRLRHNLRGTYYKNGTRSIERLILEPLGVLFNLYTNTTEEEYTVWHQGRTFTYFLGGNFFPTYWNPGALKKKLGALVETCEITFNLYSQIINILIKAYSIWGIVIKMAIRRLGSSLRIQSVFLDKKWK